MKRVTGIGGIFFNATDPLVLRAWYQTHLGIDVQEWGGAAFSWTDADGKATAGTTIWTIGDASGNAFAPSTAAFACGQAPRSTDAPMAGLARTFGVME